VAVYGHPGIADGELELTAVGAAQYGFFGYDE
jgi:hypothetical protein